MKKSDASMIAPDAKTVDQPGPSVPGVGLPRNEAAALHRRLNVRCCESAARKSHHCLHGGMLH